MIQEQRTEVVCAVIVSPDGRVYSCKRPTGVHLPGLWEFPGGKVEHGESLRDALGRELHEELGVRAEVGHLIHTVEWTDGERRITLHAFRCEIGNQPIVLREHDDARWVNEPEARLLSWAPADIPILDRLFSASF